MITYDKRFEIINVLNPENQVIREDHDLSHTAFVPPRMVLKDTIAIFRDKENCLTFYDVRRQKFVAKCIFKVHDYQVVGDHLIMRTDYGYKKLVLPFLKESRDGDFLFYTFKNNSLMPNPFTSINDVLPSNKLEPLVEFAVYKSSWSTLNHSAAFLDAGRIT